MASTKRTARPARKKYVPSAKQRADDERLKENLNHLSKDDLGEFDKLLGNAINNDGPGAKAGRVGIRVRHAHTKNAPVARTPR